MKGLTELAVLEERLENRYRIEGTVGAGSYGKAVLATRKADGERVVIKQINVSDVDEQTRESAQREAQLLSCFSHPNVVKYYECMLDDGCLNIVMEYASEGELSDAIAKRAAEKKPFTEDEIMMWFVQILLALYHVHSKNILHRDLKSQNIFISEGNILKLGDFGISRVLNSDTELARTVIGTPYYLSPEICEDKPYNRKSDVWALGCVLYELCMLKRAFDGQSLPALVVKILKGKYPPVPTRYCSSLRHLVDTMLQQNPRDRPSIDGILRLSFVRGHVERYAQHVMALSPVTPENLGLPADATPEPRARPAAATPARTPAAGVTPVKARTPAAAVAASVQRSSSGEGAAPLSERSARAPAATYDRASAAALQAPGLQQPSSRPSSAASSNLDQGLKGVAAPPSADAGAAGFVGGKMPPNARLGAGTWMRNQQAQLAELEGALALKGHGAGAGASAAIGRRNAAQPEAVPSREAEPELVGRVVPAARVGSGGEASSSLAGGGASIARAQVLQMKQAQKEAELQAAQLAVQQERDRKKAAAAKRDAEKSIAVKSRVVERQRETERHLAEQRVREEEKQARARERAEQLRSKEEDKAKLREELAAHMAAHAAQVKAARARVNRDELSKLGADFASRLHHVPSLPGAAAQVLVVDAIDDPPARSNSSGSARPTAASSGSGVSPARPSPTAAATRGRLGAAPSPSAGKPAPQQQQAAAQQEPPWRAARAAPKPAGAAAGFPDVQIFTPFGSELTPGKAAAAARPGVAAPSRSNSNGGQAASPAPSRTHVAATAKSDQDKVLSIWARKGKEELLEVLSQIQEVLAEEGEGEDEEEEDDAPGPAAPLAPRPPPGPRVSAGRAGVQRGKHGGVHLPPEEDGDERGGSGSASARPSGSSDAAGNAHKVEQLRMMLESELGADAFLAAYRYVRQVSRQAEEGGEDDEGAAAQQHAALIHMCGKKAHLAHRIHTLITLEDKVFK